MGKYAHCGGSFYILWDKCVYFVGKCVHYESVYFVEKCIHYVRKYVHIMGNCEHYVRN